MNKFNEFEHYLVNLDTRERELRENLEEIQSLIVSREISIRSDKEILSYSKQKLEKLIDQDEINKLKQHISDIELRLEASQEVLVNTKLLLQTCEKALSGSKLEDLARAAVDEMYQEIINAQILFTKTITEAEAARDNYLKKIIEIGNVRNYGRGIIERLKKAVLHAKMVSPSYAEFETGLTRFLVGLDVVKPAFYRGTLK